MIFKIILFFLGCILPLSLAQLRVGFYTSTCPRAELIIRQVVQRRFNSDRSITAALLRMHFHDCFVRGCDASILIDSTGTTSAEKDAGPNQTVRGFELIDEAKASLEAVCPSTVSCADIITLATRNAVFLAGGPDYSVPTGRRDGLVSNSAEVDLPGPSLSISEAFPFFASKGLSLNDMVTLLGAHTVGVAHCGFFQDRLSDFQGTGQSDPSMDPAFADKLSRTCGTTSRPPGQDPTAFLDQNTSFVFDSQFYKQVLLKKGILQIDQALTLDRSSAPIVSIFASNEALFRQNFINAIIRMEIFKFLLELLDKLGKIAGSLTQKNLRAVLLRILSILRRILGNLTKRKQGDLLYLYRKS